MERHTEAIIFWPSHEEELLRKYPDVRKTEGKRRRKWWRCSDNVNEAIDTNLDTLGANER